MAAVSSEEPGLGRGVNRPSRGGGVGAPCLCCPSMEERIWAALFSWIIARAGLPVALADWLSQVTSNGVIVLGLIVIVLLVIGMFIETISALILAVPVLTPIAANFGFDPIHFSVVTIIAVLIGSLTPPVAVLLLLTCKIGGVDYARTMRPLVPFLLVLFIGLLGIMYVPALTLALPRLFGYGG